MNIHFIIIKLWIFIKKYDLYIIYIFCTLHIFYIYFKQKVHTHIYIIIYIDTIINNKWTKNRQIEDIFIDKELTFFLFNTILNEYYCYILLLQYLNFVYYILL